MAMNKITQTMRYRQTLIQLAVHSRKYNAFPIRPLKWQSPRKMLHNIFNHISLTNPQNMRRGGVLGIDKTPLILYNYAAVLNRTFSSVG